MHAFFDTFINPRNEAHTRVGGVAVDIAATDDATAQAAHTKAGSSEIVVEEHSVADLLSKFKQKDEHGPPLAPTLTTPTLLEAKPIEPTRPSQTEAPVPSQTVAVQPNPTIQSLKHPSQTSVASSSVTSFTSDLTGEVETDTDKGISFYKSFSILKRTTSGNVYSPIGNVNPGNVTLTNILIWLI